MNARCKNGWASEMKLVYYDTGGNELLRTGGNSLIATVINGSLKGDVVPEPKIPAIVMHTKSLVSKYRF